MSLYDSVTVKGNGEQGFSFSKMFNDLGTKMLKPYGGRTIEVDVANKTVVQRENEGGVSGSKESKLDGIVKFIGVKFKQLACLSNKEIQAQYELANKTEGDIESGNDRLWRALQRNEDNTVSVKTQGDDENGCDNLMACCDTTNACCDLFNPPYGDDCHHHHHHHYHSGRRGR